MSVSAIKKVAEETDKQIVIDLNDIKIEKKAGAETESSELIDGLVIDKERVHTSMPRLIKDAKVLLLDAPIEVKDTEIDAKYK